MILSVAPAQIDKDVARTRVGARARRAALRRVLVAYAARNPTLGYCQAMNFVAAALLDALGGDEAAAFGALARLCEAIAPGCARGAAAPRARAARRESAPVGRRNDAL